MSDWEDDGYVEEYRNQSGIFIRCKECKHIIGNYKEFVKKGQFFAATESAFDWEPPFKFFKNKYLENLLKCEKCHSRIGFKERTFYNFFKMKVEVYHKS